ncbi:xylulokinase [Kaistia dalseonensis]|uniref:Xylulose kinase n=1 Tax=Kaistia dalseonensis TaxID=410840 RepID=A0ABU0HD15_9HYPH|nr:xylulokinase [Kaistia dalseonensis]MCX5497552.1 xylulokinase [Kaistia dalseonensis]MDQ0440192.1 xylulokinase [Kaistia dalseonensis]
MASFIGIDIGTSAVKALLVDENQIVLAETDVSLPISRPHPLWSEQDPEDWWRAVETAVGRLREGAPAAYRDVTAIGLSGQMHGAVLMDEADRILRPAILWNDGRSHEECAELERRVPDLGTIAGVPAMPGFTAPKLLWVAHHEPEVFAKVAHVLLPKDYVRLRMTGDHISDMSDAAGTLWLDEARRNWSEPLVAATGLRNSVMPRLVEGSEAASWLSPQIASNWGLPHSVIVAGGAGDAAAGGIGIGAIDEGDAFISLGTSGQFFVVNESYRPYPEAFVHSFAHALPDRWFQMAAMLNGASALAWAARLVGEGDIAGLLARVEATPPKNEDLLFLPYLAGERTPHNDPYARGVFFGLDAATETTDLIRAVLEGVAFSFADAQAALASAGTRPKRMGAIGGGAKSPYWMQIFADVLGVSVVLHEGGAKGPAFGAARLAMLAAGHSDLHTICTAPPINSVIEPSLGAADRYGSKLERYRRLYSVLKAEFPRH